MRPSLKRVCVLSAILSVLCAERGAFAQPSEGMAARDPVAVRIERMLAQHGQLRARTDLRRFYEERGFEPAWLRGEKVNGDARELLQSIDEVSSHGLSSGRYHRTQLDALLAKIKEQGSTDARSAEVDLLLSDAFFTLGSDLSQGRFDPYTQREHAVGSSGDVDLVSFLTQTLASHTVSRALEGLAPRTEDYQKLREALAHFERIAAQGGWPTGIPTGGKKIEPGARDRRIVKVRQRLEATGEARPLAKPRGYAAKVSGAPPRTSMVGEVPADGALVYDEKLVEDVKAFQEKYGLNPDGVIGKRTIETLNATAAWRACQIRINLDRMRALRSTFAVPRYLVVNVPDFRARVMEGGKEVLGMKVIVGRLDRKTPLMHDMMRFIVFSPKWHVPTSIAVKDKLPHIREDPGYLRRHGMKLYAAGETGIEEVEPESVDWDAVGSGHFPYRIVQRSGDANALGRVKFMFPNRHAVYLHDTPTKYLFDRDTRTYSSGCIRIQKPVELAEYLLADKEGWNRDRIIAAMNRSSALFVQLDEHLPISILYLTAWIDADGATQFRHDIYGKDRALRSAFCKEL